MRLNEMKHCWVLTWHYASNSTPIWNKQTFHQLIPCSMSILWHARCRPEGSTEEIHPLPGGIAVDALPWQRTRTQQWKELLFSLQHVPRQQCKCFLRVWSQEVFSTGPIPGYSSPESVKLVQFRSQSEKGGSGPWLGDHRQSSLSRQFGDCEWVCRKSWALASEYSAES
jgi:hypothetical protein